MIEECFTGNQGVVGSDVPHFLHVGDVLQSVPLISFDVIEN